MNWKDELLEEMGYTICPICFPEYVYCDEDCEHCKEYIDFKQFYERRKIEMCKYCEKGKYIEERAGDNIFLEIYGKHLRVIGRVLGIPLGRDIIIEYCPMCRKKVRR